MSRFNENYHRKNERSEEIRDDSKDVEQLQKRKKRKSSKEFDLRVGVESQVKNMLQGQYEIEQALQQPKKDNDRTIRFFDVISIVNDLPLLIRKRVIEECNWTEGTYNTKFRVEISPSFAKQSTIRISYAELMTVLKIYVEEVGERLRKLQEMQVNHSKQKP